MTCSGAEDHRRVRTPRARRLKDFFRKSPSASASFTRGCRRRPGATWRHRPVSGGDGLPLDERPAISPSRGHPEQSKIRPYETYHNDNLTPTRRDARPVAVVPRGRRRAPAPANFISASAGRMDRQAMVELRSPLSPCGRAGKRRSALRPVPSPWPSPRGEGLFITAVVLIHLRCPDKFGNRCDRYPAATGLFINVLPLCRPIRAQPRESGQPRRCRCREKS